MRLLLAFTLALSLPALAQKPTASPWELEPSQTTADLRGVHAVGSGVVWASGTNGTVLRSQDSGFEWQNCTTPPGADKLDFRAIWAWDDQTAVVMSSGPGDLSRIYKTTDGCSHWTLLRTNADKDGFWDGLVFSDRHNGYLLGDPVGGELVLARTADGGKTWIPIHSPTLKVGNRGVFAASNSALALGGAAYREYNVPWIATSGTGAPGGGALVLQGSFAMCSMNVGPETCLSAYDFWTVGPIPIAGASATEGIFSLTVLQNTEGISGAIVVGGDYKHPDETKGTAAYQVSLDQPPGEAWRAPSTLPGGYRSAVECTDKPRRCITVGPNGSDLSRDDGHSWEPLEHAPSNMPQGGEWNALSLPWAVGPHGRIGKLNPLALPPAGAASVPQSSRTLDAATPESRAGRL